MKCNWEASIWDETPVFMEEWLLGINQYIIILYHKKVKSIRYNKHIIQHNVGSDNSYSPHWSSSCQLLRD